MFTAIVENACTIEKLDKEVCYQGNLLDQALKRRRVITSTLRATRLKLTNQTSRNVNSESSAKRLFHSARSMNLVQLAIKFDNVSTVD